MDNLEKDSENIQVIIGKIVISIAVGIFAYYWKRFDDWFFPLIFSMVTLAFLDGIKIFYKK